MRIKPQVDTPVRSGDDNARRWNRAIEHSIASLTCISSAMVAAVAVFGWTIQNHGFDIVSRLVVSLGVLLSFHCTSYLSKRWIQLYCFLTLIIEVAIEKMISWDLLTLLGPPGLGAPSLAALCMAGVVGDTNQFGWSHWLFLGLSLSSPLFLFRLFAWLDSRPAATFVIAAFQRFRTRLGLDSDCDMQKTRPQTFGREMTIACLLWFATVVSVVLIRPAGSQAFRLMTLPWDTVSSVNSILGYSVLVDHQPVMSETLAAHEQTARFCGLEIQDENFRYARSGYAFLASHLLLFFSVENALLGVNAISWFVCVLSTAWLSKQITGSALASILSGCFACVGIGHFVHMDSTTPHLLSFALFAFAICLFYHWRLADSEWNIGRHLTIGLLMGWTSCCYNVAQMLLAIYVLNGIWHQRWRYLIVGTFVALSMRPIWTNFLCAFGNTVAGTETDYASRALREWMSYGATGPLEVPRMLVRHVTSIISSLESPWFLMASGIAWLRLSITRRIRLLFASSVIIPSLGCLYFAPVAEARGYIVYGSSWVIYLLEGWYFSECISRIRIRRTRFVMMAIVGLLLIVQYAWITSHWHGYLGPIKLYYLGWEHAHATLIHPGQASVQSSAMEWVENSQLICNPQKGLSTLETSVAKIDHYVGLRAIMYRLPLAFGLLLIAVKWIGYQPTGRVALFLVFSFSLIFGSQVSSWQLLSVPNPVHIDRSLELAGNTELEYQLELSDSQATYLNRLLKAKDCELRIYAALPDGCELICSNETLQPSNTHMAEWIVRSPSVLWYDPHTIRLKIRNGTDSALQLAGWQRPSRTRQIHSTLGPMVNIQVVPSIELRIRRFDGSIALVLF